MSGISVHASKMKLLGQLTFGKNLSVFPLSPQVGDWCLKDFMVFAYVTFGGIDTWMPFSKAPHGYIHHQSIASLNWTVSHDLGTADIFYQIKDLEDNIVSVGITKINDNQFTIAMAEATAGSVVVLALDIGASGSTGNTGGGSAPVGVPTAAVYNYDANNLLTDVTETIDGDPSVVTYGYDTQGILLTETLVYRGVTKITTYTYTVTGAISGYTVT